MLPCHGEIKLINRPIDPFEHAVRYAAVQLETFSAIFRQLLRNRLKTSLHRASTRVVGYVSL